MTTAQFEHNIAHFIAHHSLMHNKGLYLVALSGGADSVALLLCLHRLGYRLQAIHCNFRLRGDESDRDEAFCVSLCDRLGITLHRAHFDTRFYAEQHHLSIEMAARDLRYGYFERLRQMLGADDVCVAHHQDDQVETVMMNLMRGTGLRGLLGIRPRRDHIVRPLLCLSRSDIEQYLQSLHQPYVTDSTNLADDALRNRIRHRLLPLMDELNPAARQNISQMTKNLEGVFSLWNGTIASAARDLIRHKQNTTGLPLAYDSICTNQLLHSPLPHDTLLYILESYGFHPAQADQVWQNLHAATGCEFLSATHRLSIDRDNLLLSPIAEPPAVAHSLPIEGNYSFGGGIDMFISIRQITPETPIPREPNTVMLDARELRFPLTLRTVRQADRFQPLGMKGTKLVSDYLTDRKLPLILKPLQLVMEDADGRIVWLVGHRPAHHCRITEATTQAVCMEFRHTAAQTEK